MKLGSELIMLCALAQVDLSHSSPVSSNPCLGLKINKGDKFLKKLWFCVGKRV